MRPILPALALVALGSLALPHQARADGAVLAECGTDVPGQTVECSANLTKGHDYALIIEGESGPGTVELINPAGVATVRFDFGGYSGDSDHGTEFRAAYTAAYRVRVRRAEEGNPPYGIYGSLVADCRDDIKTLCNITPGQTRTGSESWNQDCDDYKTTLRKGRTYTISMGGSAFGRLLNQNGKLLVSGRRNAPVIRYKAPYSGTYYIAVGCDNSHGPYTLSLK